MRAVGATSERGVERATTATRATTRATTRAGMRRARALARALERIRLTTRRRDVWTRGVADGDGAGARDGASVATSDSLDARAVVVRASARGRRGRGICGERARGLIFKRLDGGKTGDGRAMAD